MVSTGILVTGGAGFIGSTLLMALVRRGRGPLVCLDDFNDYYDPAQKRRNIAEVQQSAVSARPITPQAQAPPLAAGAVTVIEGDICDPAVVERAAEAAGGLDAIVHLAARAGVRASLDDPPLYARVNLVGTTNLLEVARRRGVRRFVLASTSAVYGNCPNAPFREDEPLTRPVSPYGATKLACEMMAHTYHHLFGLSAVCLRFFTAYGPRQRPDMALHKFARLMAKGEPLPLYGDGSTSRDYTYIDDIVSGVVAAIDAPADFEIINLGNTNPVTLAEMVAVLERVMGVEARIRRLPEQPGDVTRTWADISRARRILGYAPTTEFQNGVRRFVEWFRGATRGS